EWALVSRVGDRRPACAARHVLVAGDDPGTTWLTESCARFCDIAARADLTAGLEWMPWTAVPDLQAALAIVEGADRLNGGVLVDALHFDRSATTLEEIAALPGSRVNYVQFCDGLVPYDPSDEGLIQVARGERLFPGQGGIDLIGLARALPKNVTISVEVPHRALAQKVDAKGRAAMAIAATQAILRAAAQE